MIDRMESFKIRNFQKKIGCHRQQKIHTRWLGRPLYLRGIWPIFLYGITHGLHTLHHMDLYAENILDHYRHPRGKFPNPETKIRNGITHTEHNPSCGDSLTVGITTENGVITDVAWDGEGCAISQASMSMLAEELTGKRTEEIHGMSKAQMMEMLGVAIGPRRVKCALLGLHTLKNTLRIAKKNGPQTWLETLEVTGQ